MKKFLSLPILLFFFLSYAKAQSWRQIQVDPTQGFCGAALFGDTGILLTGVGTVYHSYNFFSSFTVDSTFLGDQTETLVFPCPDTGYFIDGEHGLIQTTDGGLTWSPQSSARYGLAAMLAFVNDSVAYNADPDDNDDVIGFTENIWHTGQQFVVYYNPGGGNLGMNILHIRATNDSTLYVLAATYGSLPNVVSILKTTDYGSSWQLVKTLPGFNWNGDFMLTGDSTIIVVFNNIIYRSTNNGDTFDAVLRCSDVLDQGLLFMNVISFANHDTGYVAYPYGHIYRTCDAGATWTLTDFAFNPHPANDEIGTITAVTGTKVLVGCGGGDIYITTNGGGTATGIDNVAQTPAFNIYPNPTAVTLNISSTNTNPTTQTEIINTIGQSVYHSSQFKNQLDVSQLPAGLYFIQLQSEEQMWVGRFVKE